MKKRILSVICAICLIIPCLFCVTACGKKETEEPAVAENVFVSTDAAKLSGVEFANSEDVKLTKTGDNSYKLTGSANQMSDEQLAVYGIDVDYVVIRVRMAGGSTYRNGWVDSADKTIDESTSLKEGSIAEDKDVKPFVLGLRHPDTPVWKIEVTTDEQTVTYTVDFSEMFTV